MTEKTNNTTNALRGKVAAIAGILVVIPSLINAMSDIWVAWQGLPVGEKQKANSALFKDHFKEDPLLTKQIIIDGRTGKAALTLDVYTNGDIFVDYGRFIQWFPYATPSVVTNTAYSIPLLSNAYANNSSPEFIEAETASVDSSVPHKGEVLRTRKFKDGRIERKLIDLNTGQVKKIEWVLAPKANLETKKDGANLTTEVIVLPKHLNGDVVKKIDTPREKEPKQGASTNRRNYTNSIDNSPRN